MKKLFLLSLLSLLLSACEQQAGTAISTETETATKTVAAEPASAQQDFSSLMQKAEDLFAQTQAVGHSWSTNLNRLEDARQAAKAGDMVKATSNAEEAVMLSELALIQAKVEKDRWRGRVPQ